MSDLTPTRNISIALDITKSVQPANAFFIYRGDNVRFGLTFYDGDNSLSVENGATIRIFAKKIQKNGKLDLNSSPLFAKDQDYTSSETSVSIDVSSAETAGEAGHYALCIMVFNTGMDSTIRTTQLVYFDLLENGYAGSYQPSEDFRAEVLNALQQTLDAEARAEAYFNDSVEQVQNEADHIISALNTSIEEETAKAKAEVETAGVNAVGDINAAKADAKTELAIDLASAKAEIDTWSDQGERFAQNEEDISALAIDKANRGYLQFNKAKLTTATNNATTLPLTLCATYECADLSSGYFNFLATHIVRGWTSAGQTGSTSGFGFGVIYNENYTNRIFGVKLSTPDSADVHVARHGYDYGVWLKSDSFDKFEGRHTFIATISEEITNGVPKIVLYFDGSVLSSNRNFKYNGGLQSAELGTGQGKILTGSTEYSPTSISTLPIKISRLKIFNCVLPATKADDTSGIGYTIEDYNNGIDEPPTVKNGKDYQPQLSNTGSYALYGTQTIGTNAVASIDSALNALVVSLSADTTPTSTSSFNVSRTYYPYKIKAGDKISIKIASATRNGNVFNNDYKADDFYKYEICSTNENNSTTAAVEESFIKKSWSDANIEETVTATKDASYIAFRMTQSLLKNLNTIPSGTELYRWTGVEIKVNGALLSLADYTFNGEVLDASGNGNHATISGNVAGTNDTAVETLYQKIAARISNNS